MTLILSDGTKSIKATENQRIHAINKFLLPGTKVMIKGKHEYTNRTIQIDNSNFEILGGLVPEISTVRYLISGLHKLL